MTNFFITGDTHGEFMRISYFIDRFSESPKDILIILGDSGINYHGGETDRILKVDLSKLSLTLFCIHGNHDLRPETLPQYQEITWHDGKAYFEPEFPNLIFAKDGEIYNFNGLKTLAIGGASSIDKIHRLVRGWKWFPDEQPSQTIKEHTEKQLDTAGWKVDAVLSHTCPHKYLPDDLWSKKISDPWLHIDHSTEHWLDSIEEKLDYNHWYCGHFHVDRTVDKLKFMFKTIREFK